MRRLCILPFIFLALLAYSWAQTPNPLSDPQALTLAAQALTALTGGQPMQDVTLTASVTRSAGSDVQTGTANLQAKGTWESRVALNLTDGLFTELRNSQAGVPQGLRILQNGSQQGIPFHNCAVDASWFFPALSALNWSADPDIILSYRGQATLGGNPIQHIQSSRNFAGPGLPGLPTFQGLSTTDFYLDANTLLPVAIMFQAHPDDDALTTIPVTIMFSDYRSVSGASVPFHIQKYYNGTLLLDLMITNVAVNTNLPDSLFSTP